MRAEIELSMTPVFSDALLELRKRFENSFAIYRRRSLTA